MNLKTQNKDILSVCKGAPKAEQVKGKNMQVDFESLYKCPR